MVGASAVLFACNAIVGVTDVTPKEKTTKRDGGSSDPDADLDPGGDPDATTGPTDKGTLALGYNHACARMTDGTVRCWGDNGAGQLGDGVPFDGPRPDALKPQVVPGISKVIAIASGLSHTCVVHEAGNLSCWGLNFFGQLGDGTKERSSKPVEVLTLKDAVAVAGGTSFTCAVRKDKTAACWGANYDGQLGDGTKTDRPTAAPVKDLAGVLSLTAATSHACAVLEDNSVMCWGANTNGQLGTGDLTPSLTPTKLNGLTSITQVAAAASFTCALDKTGRVYCWGANQHGELGNGAISTSPNPSPSIVPAVDDATFIWTGFEHACAVRRSGEVSCWGSAGDGQLGKGSVPTDASIPTPVNVVGVPSTLAVWTGGTRSCAVVRDGRAFCWGQNSTGQLGNGTKEVAYAAVPVLNFP